MQKNVAITLQPEKTGAPANRLQQKAGSIQACKVLYIVQLPPPVHGVSAMNQYVVSSPVINKGYATQIVPLRFSTNNNQLEKASLSKAWLFLTHGFKIAGVMRRFKPQLVYFTFMPTGFAFYRDALYVMLLKLFSPKIVLHLHGKGIKRSVTEKRWKQRLYRMVFKNTQVISLSNILAGDVADIYENRPYVVPNGIQVNALPAPKQQAGRAGVPQILFLSNYIENKGVLVLMRALAILNKKGYRFNARFVGAPTNLSVERLNEVAAEYGVTGSVEIVGPRYGNEKYEELRRADIFAFPTYNDAFPLVTLEAMQFALPVVSTDEGGVPDIVNDNETGFLVERRNPQMLAEKLALLLADENLRREMGRKGYERFMNHFTLAHFEQNLKNTLDTILAQPAK